MEGTIVSHRDPFPQGHDILNEQLSSFRFLMAGSCLAAVYSSWADTKGGARYQQKYHPVA